MSTVLKFRRGDTTVANAFTGQEGELFVDTTKDTLVVHDGVTAGGKPLATESYVTTQLNALIGGAPAALNTLNELATALNNDSNYATTITTALAGKQATLVSGTNIKSVAGKTLLGSGNVVIDWSDINNKPAISTAGLSGNYYDLANLPTLFSGSYTDLTNKPTIPSFDQSLNTTNDVTFKKLAVKDTTLGASGGGWARFGYEGSGFPHVTINGSFDNTNLVPGQIDAWHIRTVNRLEIYNGGFWIGGTNGNPNEFVVNNGSSQPRWTSIKTINGQSLIGSGDITISGGSSFSGSYTDLTNKPTLFSGSYNDLTDKPTFKTINGQSIVGVGNITISGGSGGSSLTYGQFADNEVDLVSTAANQVIDSYDASLYRSSKYIIQAVCDQVGIHSTEVMVMHDGSTVYITEYATMFTNSSLFTVDANIAAGNVNLTVTPANPNTSFDVVRTSLAARTFTTPSLQGDLMTLSGSEDLQTATGSVDLNA